MALAAVRQEAQGSLPLPRSSIFCSWGARGAAAARPKMEERIMVERMVIGTGGDLIGKDEKSCAEA